MKRALALLLLLLPLLSTSQIRFESGYFIENGIKTECLIKNVAWKNNPVSFEYKMAENEDPKIKTINTVSEFNVRDAYKFIRFTVNIDRSETLLDRLDDTKEPKWNKETLFLKVLVEGKLNLYHYEENNFSRYFTSGSDIKDAQQLVFKEYKIGSQVGRNNYYRQQLYNLMKDGDNMDSFKNIKYNKEELVNLFTGYNGKSGQKTNNLSERQNKGHLNLKFTPGIVFSSLNIENSVTGYDFDFGNKTSYRIGAELEYVMPFNNNKWSIFLDPNYQSFKKSGNRGTQKLDAKYSFIELPVGVRYYMYLTAKSKLFVDAAYVLSIDLGDNQIQYSYSDLEVAKNSNLALGGGFSYNRYSIEARANFSHSILDNYVSWSANYSTFNIILGYNFL
jgi:hypothetical protein